MPPLPPRFRKWSVAYTNNLQPREGKAHPPGRLMTPAPQSHSLSSRSCETVTLARLTKRRPRGRSCRLGVPVGAALASLLSRLPELTRYCVVDRQGERGRSRLGTLQDLPGRKGVVTSRRLVVAGTGRQANTSRVARPCRFMVVTGGAAVLKTQLRANGSPLSLPSL